MAKVFPSVLTGALLCAQIVSSGAVTGAPAPDIRINTAIRKEVLAALANELETKYAIVDTGNKLAALLRAKLKANAYKSVGTAPEFARELTADLYTVAHDKHLGIRYSFAPLPKGPPGAMTPDVLKQMRGLNGGIQKAEVLDGNVGYLCVTGVLSVQVAREAVAAAFAFLHETDALIIDNRGNRGGDPRTVALYMSYLSEGKPYVVNTFHWRVGNHVEEFKTTELGELSYGAHKPVFVLTSPDTFSGGEELTYDLQVFKRGVVVGEVTGGGANPGGPIPLPHQFVVNMPGAQAVNPVTGTSWEGVGVKPDVQVSAATALSVAHALAIKQLTAEATDSQTRATLEAVAMKLEFVSDAESATAPKLTHAEIAGTYVPQDGRGSALTILEKDGHLVQHRDNSTEIGLVLLKGNHYQFEGQPPGSGMSFRRHDAKLEMLLESPYGPPTIREKQ